MLNQKIIVLAFFGLCMLANYANAKKVVCYYTNWAQYRQPGGKFYPEDVDANLCTHIIYSFAKLDGNSELAAYEWNDESTSWSKGMYERATDLKARNPNLKIMIAVGGWNHGSGKFSNMVTDSSLRSKFVSTAVTFLTKNKFDGLDLDWEYPGSRAGSRYSDKQLFTTLTRELKAAFASRGLLLSAAVSAGKSTIDSGYEVAAVSQNLDFINLMAYDLHGSWESFAGFNAPLYGSSGSDQLSVDYAVNYWISKGASPEKLILGLGTYGRSFTLSSSASAPGSGTSGAGTAGRLTREGGFMAYYEICEKLSTGWSSGYSNTQKVPYAYSGNQWVGYDNPDSLRLKAQYAMSKSLGGIMFWALDLDDFKGEFCGQGTYPLIRSAIAGMGDSTIVVNTPAPVTNQPNVVYTNPPVTFTNPPVIYTNPPVTNPPIVYTNPPTTTVTYPSGSVCFRGDGHYADKSTGCSRFYQCVWTGTAYAQVYYTTCPNGLLFDENITACNWASLVTC